MSERSKDVSKQMLQTKFCPQSAKNRSFGDFHPINGKNQQVCKPMFLTTLGWKKSSDSSSKSTLISLYVPSDITPMMMHENYCSRFDKISSESYCKAVTKLNVASPDNVVCEMCVKQAEHKEVCMEAREAYRLDAKCDWEADENIVSQPI